MGLPNEGKVRIRSMDRLLMVDQSEDQTLYVKAWYNGYDSILAKIMLLCIRKIDGEWIYPDGEQPVKYPDAESYFYYYFYRGIFFKNSSISQMFETEKREFDKNSMQKFYLKSRLMNISDY